jgi:hypothetical protein
LKLDRRSPSFQTRRIRLAAEAIQFQLQLAKPPKLFWGDRV